jgi:hypothetical protein
MKLPKPSPAALLPNRISRTGCLILCDMYRVMKKMHNVGFFSVWASRVGRGFGLSRWRGRRCACDTGDIMGCHSILNRFSPSAVNSLLFCILQAKIDSIPIE